jgi:F-box and WD-40 domain protein CDC4
MPPGYRHRLRQGRVQAESPGLAVYRCYAWRMQWWKLCMFLSILRGSKLTSDSVTHTTRTTTSFAPINLPRIPPPEIVSIPYELPSELYPLAHEPAPEDLQYFALNLGGRRVVVQEEGTNAAEAALRETRGPGWTRTLTGAAPPEERIGLVQAFGTKGKERKRTLKNMRAATLGTPQGGSVPTPPVTGQTVRQRSPPRKRIRSLDEMSLDSENALLSPMPSPELDNGPTSASSASPPSVGSGLEVAALFSLPSIISQFDTLPDKLQQHVLMHLFRRSRMPTIQRLSAFTSTALKRDFVAHLPHEVAIQILLDLDLKSLLAASKVSKKWRKMVDGERAIWMQRLKQDGLYYGVGTEREEEILVGNRFNVLDEQNETFGTPVEDVEMGSMSTVEGHDLPPLTPEDDRPTALKHVYRRRLTSNRDWLTREPRHSSFAGQGTNVVTCLQFDSDKIISASDDHTINVYDTATGALRKRLEGHEGGVWALEYKNDTLVSGSTDRTVRVWDLENLCESHVFHGHTSTVRCLQIVEPEWDPSHKEYFPPYPMIVTGSRDSTLRVWKLPQKGDPGFRYGVSLVSLTVLCCWAELMWCI